MSKANNEREFSRAAVRVKAVINSENREWVGHVSNVSANGVLITCPSPPPLNASCEVALYLDESNSQPAVRAQGIVRRTDPASVAIEFKTILSAESWDHLKKLVLYNVDNIAQAEAELAEHIGLKRRNA